MKSQVILKNESIIGKGIRKYLFSDVVLCTLTFKDGLCSKLRPTPGEEMVLVQLVPQCGRDEELEEKVRKNYMSAKTVSELAKKCGFSSVKTFTRHFKKIFKMTPYQWILDKKMDEINALLINSDITITEISKLYNFNSISHLGNLYSKRFGCPPSKTRMMKRNP